MRHSKVRPSIPQLNAAGKSVIGGDMKIGDPAAWAQGAAAFICTALIASGILIIVLSHGFFMNLLGAGTAACGGAAAYLTLAERRSA